MSCFKQQITYLTKRGFKPILNIINNVASKAVQAYLESEKVNIQLVEPHNHKVNAAERVIHTSKNHLIAGLSACDVSFPSLLWNKIVPQAQDSLNMLRTSRVHPNLSTYSVLEGIHDFNIHPWAPLGTRATIFSPPETRTSFGPRAIDAWYIGLDPQIIAVTTSSSHQQEGSAQVDKPHSTCSIAWSQNKPRLMIPDALRHTSSR